MKRIKEEIIYSIYVKNKEIEDYVMSGKCNKFAMYICVAFVLYLLAQIVRSFFQ